MTSCPSLNRKRPRWVLQVALCAVLCFFPMLTQSQHYRPHAKPEGRASQKAAVRDDPHLLVGHETIAAASKRFPTLGYDDARAPRPVQTRPPAVGGDPGVGKQLAYDENKGRCLNCHVLGKDGVLSGDVAPNLSKYGIWGGDAAYTFQQVWDARAHNPHTVMPPFGTNEVLNEAEVAHIVAYLRTLKQWVAESPRPLPPSWRERVSVAGVDFSAADDYIDAGRAAFNQTGRNGNACASCHSQAARVPVELSGAASRYPRIDAKSGDVVGLEEQVNICRRERMASEPLALGDRTMTLLVGYVKYLGRGKRIAIESDAKNAQALERGRGSFHRKAGQLNFSCADCHVSLSNHRLRGQRLQGLERTAGGWPKHFVGLHDLGYISLRFRIQYCQTVTRTDPLPLHSREYRELEYYLTWLANGSPVLAPTLTRPRGE